MDVCVSQHNCASFYAVGSVHRATNQSTEDTGKKKELNLARNAETAK